MKTGYSLLETIIYMALLAIFISIVGTIFVWVINSDLTIRTSRDLDSEGLRVLQIIVGDIRNGYAIGFPDVGSVSSTLTILNSSNPSDTTRFSLANNQIFIREDGGSATAVTSVNVSVTDLNFTNISRPGTPGAVTAQFKITNKKLKQNFHVSASIRRK